MRPQERQLCRSQRIGQYNTHDYDDGLFVNAIGRGSSTVGTNFAAAGQSLQCKGEPMLEFRSISTARVLQ